MTDEQLDKFAEKLGNVLADKPPKSAREIWFERLRLTSYIISIVTGILVLWKINSYETARREQEEMIKAYLSGQQAKYSEFIGIMRGQGDKKTADILEILKDDQKRRMENLILIKED